MPNAILKIWHEGSQSYYEIAGTQGPQGAIGPQGYQGPQGSQGYQGDQGNVGSAGPQGAQGTQGQQGVAGPQGNVGAQGPQGVAGAQGYQGSSGPQGLQGPQGPQGATGATGIYGGNSQPYIFKSGYTSPTSGQVKFNNASFASVTEIKVYTTNNASGDCTTWLDNMDISTNSIKGTLSVIKKLDANVYRVFDVTSNVTIGSSVATFSVTPIVTNGTMSDNDEVVLSYVHFGSIGAQGAQGFQGSQGAQGQPGPQGVQGLMGPQGSPGPQGNQGAQGHQGQTGLQGSQGPQGNVGAQGPTGPQGNQGATGSQGATGPQGSQGPQGAQGLLGDALAHAVTINTGGFFKIGTGTKDSNLNGIQIDSTEIVGQVSGADVFMFGVNGSWKLKSGSDELLDSGSKALDVKNVGRVIWSSPLDTIYSVAGTSYSEIVNTIPAFFLQPEETTVMVFFSAWIDNNDTPHKGTIYMYLTPTVTTPANAAARGTWNSGSAFADYNSNHYKEFSAGFYPSCFDVETTLITMADGSKKLLKLIKEGDRILSYDRFTNKKITVKVLKVRRRTVNEYVLLNGKTKVTDAEKFLTNRGFVFLKELLVGDYIIKGDGSKERIDSKLYIQAPLDIATLTVEKPHIYIANDYAVHNKATQDSYKYAIFDSIHIKTNSLTGNPLTTGLFYKLIIQMKSNTGTYAAKARNIVVATGRNVIQSMLGGLAIKYFEES